MIALAAGFGCYALWRLSEGVFGHKVESRRDESAWKRAGALGKAAIYGSLSAAAVSVLIGGGGGNGGSGKREQEATAGILGWPGGKWIVMALAAAIAAAALWNLYRGLSRRSLDQLKTGEMSETARRWATWIGVIGLIARGVVFALIAWFFFKAAVDYDPEKARGLDGALRKLATAPYGSWAARHRRRRPVCLRRLVRDSGALSKGLARREAGAHRRSGVSAPSLLRPQGRTSR